MAFRIALSGLNAASTELEVTGNNIANAATNGFKESRAEFADLYANSIQDASAASTGQGVRVARVAQQFTQGSIDFTSNNLDLAISGQGFFVMESSDGDISYTRAGAYSADRDGSVVDQAGKKLQVYPAINNGGLTTFSTGVLEDLSLPTSPSAPNATSSIEVMANLNASNTVPTAAFNPADPSSYNGSTSITSYDSQGNTHTSTLYFRKAATNDWTGHMYLDGNPVTQGGSTSFSIGFDDAGAMTTPTDGLIAMDAISPGAGVTDMTVTLDINGMTQFGSPFSVNNLAQDGYTTGRLAGVDIDSDGVFFARYTNGRSEALGKLALAKFNNEQGMRPIGDTNWAETFNSGAPQLGEAGTSSFGQIQSGALEASNVDIAEQLVRLITAQRNFQSNAEVISTTDQITQTIINIR